MFHRIRFRRCTGVAFRLPHALLPMAGREHHRPRVCRSFEYPPCAASIRCATPHCAAHNTFYSCARDLFTRFRACCRERRSGARKRRCRAVGRSCGASWKGSAAVCDDSVPDSRAVPVLVGMQAMYSTSLLRCDGAARRCRQAAQGSAAALSRGDDDAATCDTGQPPRGLPAR